MRSRRKQQDSATAVIAQWTLVWVLLFSIMLKTLSLIATTLILSSQCCPFSYSYWLMNACNLTSALALEKGKVWLPKISVINPLRSSFIISSSIHTAQQRSNSGTITSWMNTEPHCDFLFSNSWRVETGWITFDVALGEERKFEFLCCSEGTFGITKVQKKNKTQRNKKGCFSFCFKSQGVCGVEDASRFSIEF